MYPNPLSTTTAGQTPPRARRPESVAPPAQLIKESAPGDPLLPKRPNAPLLDKCPMEVL